MSMVSKKVAGFEAWMLSNLAAGAATTAFLSLLVPPFITAVTNSPARAGIVLALVGLCAVSGPIWGRLADKYNKHAFIYLLSLVGMVVAYAVLSFDSIIDWYSPIFGIILGASAAAQGTIGPTFIIGSGLSHKEMASQLTIFNIIFPVGQVIGGVAIAIGQLIALNSGELFLTAASLLMIFLVITCFTIGTADKRIKRFLAHANDADSAEANAAQEKPKVKSNALLSMFGMFLLVVILSSMSNNGLTSQIANIMPNVYGFSVAGTSFLVSLAGVINIIVIVIVGRWMKNVSMMKVYVTGTMIRFIGVLAMALVGLLGQGHLLLAAIAMQIAFQGSPISRLPAPEVAAKLASKNMNAGEANGFYYGASALGASIGCLVVGFGAGWYGFNMVNILATVFAFAALCLLVFALVPATRKTVK